MDKDAGVNIAVGIDMQVAPSACDASADIFAVVLEVHAEEGFGLAEVAELMIHILALLGRREKIGSGVVSDRHIVEVPDKVRAPVDHLIVEGFAADGLEVLTGVAAGDTEGKPFFFEQVHCGDDLVK